MKAMVHETYGPFEGLRLKDLERPVAGDGEVVVRVQAAAVHVGDCFGVRGSPFLMRMATGLFRPKHGIPGYDFAGVVSSVGKNVSRWSVGQAVFGASEGTCAEYVRVSADTVADKPDNLSFEEAAAVPTSALAALHALRDTGKVVAGKRVLINGAAGGVGTFAVQLAKSLGAEVTGVCSTRNVGLVRSLGADQVVDYTQEDFASQTGAYDLILDNVENRSLAECRRALTPDGMLILNSGTGASGVRLLWRIMKPLLLSPWVGHRLRRFLSVPNREDLEVLAVLLGSEKLRPVVDRAYPLDALPEALRYLEQGHARGKVVVQVNERVSADATDRDEPHGAQDPS